MAKKQQDGGNLFPKRSEREWWMEKAQNEALGHWLPEEAEKAFKAGLDAQGSGRHHAREVI